MKTNPRACAAPCICSAVVLLAIAVAGVARADAISYSATTGPLSTDWSAPLSVPQFDPALGTLTLVQLRLDGSSFVDTAVENLIAAPRSVAFTETVDLSVDGLGLSPLLTLSLVANGQKDLGSFDGTVDFGGGSGFTRPEIETDGTLTDTWSSGFGLFSGLGTLDFLASAGAISEFSGPANALFSQSTSASATLTINYVYTPTSVPDSLSTGITLLASLGLLRLLRRRLA